MTSAAKSSDPLDDVRLAVMIACQHRGPLSDAELRALLPGPSVEQLVAGVTSAYQSGWLTVAADRWRITDRGQQWLDALLERIEEKLAPDSPAYIARYRREVPTLPFEANTTWAEAVCVNFRVDPAALRPLVPPVFELDLHGGYAWVSLTASRLKDFGVGTLPAAMRMNFYQATYRAHCVYTDFRGARRHGCYFIRSETSSAVMSTVANLLPEFKAHRCGTCPILMVRKGEHWILSVDSGDDPAGKVVLVLDTSELASTMPASSKFASVDDARKLIVDFYDAFSYDPDTHEVFVLQIDRGPWNITIPRVVDQYFGFASAGPFPPGTAAFDSVFYFQNTAYRWLPLVKERSKVVG